MERPSTASLERDAGRSNVSDPRFFIPWRLSGLLSGYLPTDTRPQARAKLGKLEIRLLILLRNIFFRLRTNFPSVLTNWFAARAADEQT
jgi:hypothetical protein